MTSDTGEGLEIKTYFAGTIEAAMDQALRELGPDALLLNSRRAPPEARHLGEYEAVFATSPADRAAAAGDDTPGNDSNEAAWGLVSRELRDLRIQVRQMRDAMAGAPAPAQLAEVYDLLTRAEVESDLAREIVEGVGARLAAAAADGAPDAAGCGGVPAFREAVRSHLEAELEGRMRVESGVDPQAGRARVVALVGPPGAGKTTTLVKLAVACGLTTRRSVQLLSMDACRIAGADQLRTYAAILGVGFQALETTRTLEQAIAEHSAKSLVLVDTPGFSPSTMEDGADLAGWLAGHPEVDTHLVLPASMRLADMRRAMHQFAAFRPAKLLFTRLDETDAWGSIFCLAARSQRPLSYLAHGPMIPEDLEPATTRRVLEGMLGPPARRARSAA